MISFRVRCADPGCNFYESRCTERGIKLCNDITASLFSLQDSEGGPMKMTTLKEGDNFAGLPNLGLLNWVIDTAKMEEYLSKNKVR